MRLIQETWKPLVATLVIIVISQLIAWLIGKRIPHTAYYRTDEDRWDRRFYRYKRDGLQTLADFRYWMQEKHLQGPLFNSTDQHQVCVAIISNSESATIEPMVGSLIAGVRLTQSDRLNIRIYRTSSGEDKILMRHPYVGDIFSTVDINYTDVVVEGKAGLRGLSDRARRLLEQSLVLRDLHKQNCRYGLVLEDNLVAAHDWSDRLLRLVEDSGIAPSWLAVRLFVNEGQLRWLWFPPWDLVRLLSLTAAYTGLTLVGLFLTVGLMGPKYFSLFLLMLLFINFALIFILLGKPVLLHWRTEISKGMTFGQGTEAANLYPRQTLVDYSNYLEVLFRQAQALHGLMALRPSFDEYLPQISRIRQSWTGEHFSILQTNPSWFQRAARPDPTDSIQQLTLADRFADEDRPIAFISREFLEQ